MQIHQFVHTLNYGDAISGEAITIKRLLSAKGHSSHIYSLHAHEKVKDLVRNWKLFDEDLEAAREKGEEVAVVLHYSIASPLNDVFMKRGGFRTAVIYHNLTPAKWFAGYNARVYADLQKGRAELPAILEHSELVLADSPYNQSELLELGCERARVLPLPLDSEKWQVAANGGISGILQGHGGKNILHVGRLAPNKRVEDIIKAFYFFHHKIEPKSRLWLIGSDVDTEIYSFELRRLVSELRLKEAVEFVGSVSDGELRAFYENADLYMCMSEHEGFCVPLIEAMHFNLPIIAYDAGAVRETLGNGGLLLEKKPPALVAELMQLALNDTELQRELAEGRQAQLSRFGLSSFTEMLEAELLSPLLEQPRVSRQAGERF